MKYQIYFEKLKLLFTTSQLTLKKLSKTELETLHHLLTQSSYRRYGMCYHSDLIVSSVLYLFRRIKYSSDNLYQLNLVATFKMIIEDASASVFINDTYRFILDGLKKKIKQEKQ